MCLIDTSRRAKAYASSSSVVGLSRAKTRSRPFARSPTDRVVACFSASVTTVPLRVCPKHRHSPSSGTYPTSRATRTRSTCRCWLSSNGCETLMASSSYASGFPWDRLYTFRGPACMQEQSRQGIRRARRLLREVAAGLLRARRGSARALATSSSASSCATASSIASSSARTSPALRSMESNPVTPEDPCG